MNNNSFYHSLKIREDICIGCTHCMRSCPTGALRILNGKAQLIAEKCVDCGYCFMVCPSHAIQISDDDFDEIFNYETRVALVPAIFLSQFKNKYSISDLYQALQKIGFTYIYEIESTVELLIKMTREKLTSNKEEKYFISSFCPAVLRLIHIRFPALIKYIIPLKAPLHLTATFVKEKFKNHTKLGIFYITPCAAKIAEVKATYNNNAIDGVLNMNSMYNRIMSVLSKEHQSLNYDIKHIQTNDQQNDPFSLTKRSMIYTLTHGESEAFEGRCLAVDEIHNVIEILEKIENEEIPAPDYLELRACDESCAGGVLTVENRFLAVEKLSNRSDKSIYYSENIANLQKNIYEKYDFLYNYAQNIPEQNEELYKFAGDYETAMIKYNYFRRINNILPQVDCGVCGSPSCKDFADDVTRQQKNLEHCIFIQKYDENLDNSHKKNNIKHFTQIWGKNKIKNKLEENFNMKISNIKESLNLLVLGDDSCLNNEVKGVYMSDLLSDVMGNATEGQLWITLQNHKNVLAVAALKEMSGIIFIKGSKPDYDFIKIANEKNIALLYSEKPAFEIAGKLYELLNK